MKLEMPVHKARGEPNAEDLQGSSDELWGAIKYVYQSGPKTSDMDAMEKNVIGWLDDIPLLIYVYIYTIRISVT